MVRLSIMGTLLPRPLRLRGRIAHGRRRIRVQKSNNEHLLKYDSSGVDEQRWNELRPLVIITTSPPPTTLESVFIYFDTLPPPRRITRPTQRKTCLLSVVANFSYTPPFVFFLLSFCYSLLDTPWWSLFVTLFSDLLVPTRLYLYLSIRRLVSRPSLSVPLSLCLSASLHLVVSNVSFFILICLSPDDDDFFLVAQPPASIFPFLLSFFSSYLLRYCVDRKSTRLNSSHSGESRMPSSA